MSDTDKDLARIAALAVLLRLRAGDLKDAMREAEKGQPGGRSYEGITGGKTVMWCWDHEREVQRCWESDEHLMCDGESMPLNDRTGEAAIAGDPTESDRRRLNKAVAAAVKGMETVADIAKKYLPPTMEQGERIVTAFEKLLEDGDPGCEVCIRRGQWSATHVEASDCKKNLVRPYRLCVWCYRFVLAYGRLPTGDELTLHHLGRNVKVRAKPKAS